MLGALINNPMVPFAITAGWAIYRNKDNFGLLNTLSSIHKAGGILYEYSSDYFDKSKVLVKYSKGGYSAKAWKELEYARKAGWASLELIGAAAFSFVAYPLLIMPILNKMAEGAFYLYECTSTLSLGDSHPMQNLVNNIFSAKIVSTAAGLGVAYGNYWLWDKVALELAKTDAEVAQEVADSKTAYNTRADLWTDKTPQEIAQLKLDAAAAIDVRDQFAQKIRQFSKDYPFILPCLKYATAGSLGLLSLFAETGRASPLFPIISAGSYLASSAVTHYLTRQPGDPLAVNMVKIPLEIGKSMYEAGSDLASKGMSWITG